MTSDGVGSERGRFASVQVGRWRVVFESASVALGVALLVTIIGVCVSASGTPEYLVFDNWGRVDEISGRLVIWETVAVAAIVLLLIVPLRTLFTWPATASRAAARASLFLTILNVALLLVAAVLATVALFYTEFDDQSDYYTGTEKAGEVIYNVGIVFGLVVVGFVAVRALSLVKAPDSPEPLPMPQDAPPEPQSSLV